MLQNLDLAFGRHLANINLLWHNSPGMDKFWLISLVTMTANLKLVFSRLFPEHGEQVVAEVVPQFEESGITELRR